VTDKIAPSEQFRSAATALAENLSYVIGLREARDEAEMMVGKLEGLLAGARVELSVRQRAYETDKEMMEPQAKFHLMVMEEEANSNLDALRARSEAS
jgi:hypothetical protein